MTCFNNSNFQDCMLRVYFHWYRKTFNNFIWISPGKRHVYLLNICLCFILLLMLLTDCW